MIFLDILGETVPMAGGNLDFFTWVFSAFIIIFLLIFLVSVVLYVYTALAIYSISKRTKTEPAWLAFIPIANLYLMSKIAKKHWWPILLLLSYPLMIIPIVGVFVMFVGMVVFMVFIFIWNWKIFERVGRPGWWALMPLIPVVGLIIHLILLGVAAWGKK